MWYAYEGEWMNWHKITVQQANEIIELNKQNKTVTSLEEYALDLAEHTKVEFENVVGQDSLTRFDNPKRNNKRRTNKRKGGNKGNNRGKQGNAKNNQGDKKQTAGTKNSNQNNKRRRNTKRKPQNAKNNPK